MSNLNGQIKVYPAAEMLAVDMAEVLKAVSIVDTAVIQGCRVSVNGSKDLTMTSGRILIFGRLGYFAGGTIPVPSVNSKTTCHVWAVCELSDPSYQFYVTVLTSSQSTQLENSFKNVSDEWFNRNNGIRGLKLGTCVVIPGGKAESFKAETSMTSNKAQFNSLKTTVTNNNNSANTRITTLENYKTSSKKSIDANAKEIKFIKERKVNVSARATAADASISSIKANATISVYVTPGGGTTYWPAKSNGTATEESNYVRNVRNSYRTVELLNKNNEMIAGAPQLTTNNSDVIITGWNCVSSEGKINLRLKNLSSKEQKKVTVSGKGLLIAAKAISSAAKA